MADEVQYELERLVQENARLRAAVAAEREACLRDFERAVADPRLQDVGADASNALADALEFAREALRRRAEKGGG